MASWKENLKNGTTLILLVCVLTLFAIFSIVGSSMYFEKMAKNPTIVYIQSDLFTESVSSATLEDILDDCKFEKLISPDSDFIDKDFKTALFLSDLSIKILKKSKENTNYNKYNIQIFKKAYEKWDILIKNDPEMSYFKDIFLRNYKQVLSEQK